MRDMAQVQRELQRQVQRFIELGGEDPSSPVEPRVEAADDPASIFFTRDALVKKSDRTKSEVAGGGRY